MATLQEVAKAMALLGSVYTHQHISPQMIRAYHLTLYDLDKDVLYAAAVHIMSGAGGDEWFPKPGRIRRAAMDIKTAGAAHPSVEDAWLKVSELRMRYGKWGVRLEDGRSRPPDLGTSLIAKAIDALGGWYAFCTERNQIAQRAHFARFYGGLVEQDRAAKLELPMISQIKTGTLPGSVIDRLEEVVDRLALPDPNDTEKETNA